MRRSILLGLLVWLWLTGCDDPAPIVLGRLQTRTHDAGSQPEADAAHEREPERAGDAGERHDEHEESDEPPERE